jgi:hypothetical protein
MLEELARFDWARTPELPSPSAQRRAHRLRGVLRAVLHGAAIAQRLSPAARRVAPVEVAGPKRMETTDEPG